jgi:hypothetical protein
MGMNLDAAFLLIGFGLFGAAFALALVGFELQAGILGIMTFDCFSLSLIFNKGVWSKEAPRP